MWYSYITVKLDRDNAVVAQVTTDLQSPWFSGHFPDDPILPGIAQLAMVTATIAKVLQQDLSLQSVTRIKFKKIIRPGDVLDIHAMAGTKENHYSFKITSEQQEACSGRLVLAPTKEQ
jgi:3-hydroxymyristoyl/3-hydroxydecanoyl-(acyl carrier protein) dehydratase